MLQFYTIETVSSIPPTEYLIEGVLPEGMLLIAAAPKAGKSLIALDWGMCMGAGINWMGIETRQIPVLYVLSEAQGTLPGRVLAWQIQHGTHSSEITFACGATNLQDYKRVTKDLRPHIPEGGLIIWDTLHRNMEGDENDGRDMGNVIRTCDQLYASTGSSSMVVHHSTKEHTISAGGAKVTASWYRGHSSLLGAVDMGLSLEADELVCKAARHDEPFDPIALERRRIYIPELDRTSIVLNWSNKKVEYR